MSLDAMLLFGAVVVLAAALAARLGSRLGLPSLLLFLGLGLALELGGIKMTDASLAHALGFAALVFILAEGGFTTRWVDIKGSLTVAGLLATVGVLVSIGLVATLCHLVLGLDLPQAVLIGAITAPTDSAAVFSVLRGLPLPARVRSVLEAESGLNDAPVVLLVSAATAWTMGDVPGGGVAGVAGLIVVELVGGIILGALLGYLGARLLKAVALPASGLYPLSALAVVVTAYGAGVVLHLSGFAAVYVAALILGNSALPHRNATRSFAEGVGWIAQIGLFVMLGMMARPELLTWQMVLESLIIGTFLTFVARPIAVAVCSVWFKVPWREQAFISWAGLRGAVPIIMATVPLAANAPSATRISEEVLVFVVVFTLLQGPTLPWVARRLGIVDDAAAMDIEVEIAPLDRIQADFMQVKVPDGSRLHGVTIGELRLPKFTVIAVILRDGHPIVPNALDRINAGDELMVVVPSALRAQTEKRFREVGRHGRLARWLRD
ncbi:potassium/proton antiporter [Propioniciclava coleopterorum]|uniref:Potassium/proton antiporter n=1 Tax=Propioniciclava coleopterorum TaxID=2714937 RepID=A0A6G7Y5N3_9ACTN|nr:potassium/proton antiporter [Propioniciclava coleopterorum]QIK71927.1 potassium/proton antiporter [Propioniciclava coleopterorum]